ncbi:DNA cytosine methyltransferase [Collinsella sp. AF38-3AC]|uniref:DNA cytosine methyltransferase n=1 Tax=Collinsella sp. AF38-3AC TaxID=2292015 RepID=UPI000E4EB40A|nr:DNA cytosine methyltransferase [Collinsella sp. AF38-3AC]RHL25419.1 DNA cytosine methyltransferase [Collinsella sp. AF38-3AC]
MGFRYVSIFSGVEAATLAWGPLGWEPVAFSEIEPFPCAVLAERWPDVPNLGDITKIDWKEEIDGAIDLVVGGSPCQSFSVAGKREGLKGASGLMFEYIRCVQELRPRWFLWENVPGALTSEDGGAFGQLLSEMDELGYSLAWRVLDAQFFGVAQRRRRLFLVGHLGTESPAEVLLEPDCLSGNPQSSREKRKELARRAGRSAACAGFKYSAAPRANTIGYAEEQANTLTADWNASAVLPLCGTGQQGMSMSQYGTEIAGCLTARGDSSPCADRGQNIVCMTGTQAHCHISDEIAGCLTAHMGKDDAPVVVDGANLQTYVCETAHLGSNGLGVGKADIFPTLDTSSDLAVWVREKNAHTAICRNICPTLKCGGDGAMVASEIGDENAGTGPMLVRRLTPLECERLQGFPDGHTLIGWKGKPAEECPDGPRYKAIGNSMAVPVMRWIGKHIAMVDKS